MKNYDTPGMEFMHQYSIPEDRAIVFRSNGTQITKVWDATGSQAFEIPTAKALNLLNVFPAFRTGEYNSSGEYGFELHVENSTKTSWWTPTTSSIIFVKVASGSSRLATQVNIETGVLIGDAKPYTVIGNGSFHGIPEATPGETYFAIDLVSQWGIVLSGYGSIVQTKTRLFTHNDVDMLLSLDLDCQNNLVDVRLAYAGIWYGVHKLWYPGIKENPIQPSKGWYFPTLIGINDKRAIFLHLVRQDYYIPHCFLGIQSFDFMTKLWKTEPSPIVAGSVSPAVPIQFAPSVNKYMLTVTPNNNVHLVFVQYESYLGYGWRHYYKYVWRKLTAAGWGTEHIFTQGDTGGMAPSTPILGATFNNNDFGFAYYNDASGRLMGVGYASGAWGSPALIASGGAPSYIKVETDYDRGYMLFQYSTGTSNQLYVAYWNGSSWSISQIDDAGGGVCFYQEMAVADGYQKAVATWLQWDSTMSSANWYSCLYTGAGWSSITTHKSYVTPWETRQLGCTHNGTKAIVASLSDDGTDIGLFVDLYDGSSWSGTTLIDSIPNLFDHGLVLPGEFGIPCYFDSSGNIYVGYYHIEATPANSKVKVAYYNASTSTWTINTINTASSRNMYMSGSGDRVLVAWEQANQIYACIGENGSFTGPKRISFFNPSYDAHNTYMPTPDDDYLAPMIASYGGQYLAMMCYAYNRNYPVDYYDSLYGEKEAVIANTGYYSI